MAIKIDLLREEMVSAGIGFYSAGLDNGELFVRFLQAGNKRVPTAAEQTAIDAVVAAHNPANLSQVEQLYDTIKTTAQSAVGVALNDLTAGQRNALLAVLLWRAGGLNNDSTVKPLGEWVR